MSNLLKVALTLACMTASARGSAGTGPFCSSAAATSPTAPSNNRWVSKALAARGGADEPAETAEGGIPGVMSEVEIAVSSFNDIVGDNLMVVDNAKKGTMKEVSVGGGK